MEPKIGFGERVLKKAGFLAYFRETEKVGIDRSLRCFSLRAYAALMRDQFEENAFFTDRKTFDKVVALVQVRYS